MNQTPILTGYAFTGNPISFTDDEPGSEQCAFTVSIGGTDVYTGRYTPPATIDVADILDMHALPIPEAKDTGEWLVQVEDNGGASARTMRVTKDDGSALVASFLGFKGGVSMQNLRALAANGTDIFAARLLDRRGNFFLTTRTHGWQIAIKETELAPLYFIVEHRELRLTITAMGHTYALDTEEGIMALDIARLRRKIWEERGCIPSVFEIICDRQFCCRIVVEEAKVAKERHLVKFRNSFGAFEIVELAGEAVLSENFADADEEGGAMGFDRLTRSYVKIQTPKERDTAITVNTGAKTSEEMAFLGDMLISGETYILSEYGWEPVKTSVENNERGRRQRQPESLSIRFDFIDTDTLAMPDMPADINFRKGRTFTEIFSKTFD